MQLHYQNNRTTIYQGDAASVLQGMPEQSINTCITSPPYFGLRDYDDDCQIGLEETPEAYVNNLVQIYREVWRVLRVDGTVWLNLGDSYAGSGKAGSNPEYQKRHTQFGQKEKHERLGKPVSAATVGMKPKDLIGIPWRVALALQQDGWYLRQDIIWSKPNPMPESVTDRCTKAHEYIFLLTKSADYYYDGEAIKEKASYDGRSDEFLKGSQKYEASAVPNKKEHTLHSKGQLRWQKDENGERVRNKRSVWEVTTRPYPGAHFAVFPKELITPCVLAGCPPNGTVLDPFAGSGTALLSAQENGRNGVGIELNSDYIELAKQRLCQQSII